RRRHTRLVSDWSSDVCSSDLAGFWEGSRTVRVGTQLRNVKVSIGYMWDDDGDEGKSDGYIGLMFLGAQDPNGDGIPRPVALRNRSEERRVGKEGRTGWVRYE